MRHVTLNMFFGTILSMLLGASILGGFLSLNDNRKEKLCLKIWEDSVYMSGKCLVENNGRYVPEDNILLIKWVQ